MFKVVMIHNDSHPIPDWVDGKFRAAGIEWSYHQCETRDDLNRWASDADVVWTQGTKYGLVVEDNIDVFQKAGAVIKCGSGTDHIDHDACTKRGIMVVHSPEVPAEPTSDHHIALLFAAVRQICRQDRLVHQGRWEADTKPLAMMSGADLGVIGYGRIGRMIVKKLSGFNMTVRVFDPYLTDDTIAGSRAEKVDLETLLKTSAFVHIACPLNDRTKGLLGERELKMMRRDAILVNAARGGIVTDAALGKALREKWIAAAAVDVLEQHPLDVNDELLQFDNLIITPHSGGARCDYPDGIYIDVVEDMVRMSKGLMPRWIANKEVVPKWHLESESDRKPTARARP